MATPPEISVRPMGAAPEAEFCAQFIVASEPWLTLGLGYQQVMARLTNPAREVWVATVGERVVGVMILDLSGPLNGYLQIVAVHPDWRRRGIGTQMIHWAEDRVFRQSPNVFLCVSSFNERAQRFYSRHGYERVGELPDFVVTGYSEIILRKTRGPWRTLEAK